MFRSVHPAPMAGMLAIVIFMCVLAAHDLMYPAIVEFDWNGVEVVRFEDQPGKYFLRKDGRTWFHGYDIDAAERAAIRKGEWNRD